MTRASSRCPFNPKTIGRLNAKITLTCDGGVATVTLQGEGDLTSDRSPHRGEVVKEKEKQ